MRVFIYQIFSSGKTSSKNTNNSTIQSSVSTTYISTLTGKSVDVSPCDKILTKLKVTDSGFNLTNYLELYESLGVDVMNSEDDFFYDICIPYSRDNGTDATIGTRRNTYNTTASCSEGCDYEGIDTNGYVMCSCNSTATETEISTSISDSSFNFNVFGNIVVVKCFFRAFSKIIQNIAFWVFASALISTLIISFTYNSIFTGYKLIETKLDTILENDLDEDLIINEESKTISNKRLSLRNSIKNNIAINEQSVIKPGNVGGILDQNSEMTSMHKVTPIYNNAVNSRPQNLFDLIISTVFLVNENSVYVLFKNTRNKYSRVAKIKSRIKKNREHQNKYRGIGQLKQTNTNYNHNNIISYNNSILNVAENVNLPQVNNKNKMKISRNKNYLYEKKTSNNISVNNNSNNNYSLDKTSSSITTRSKCLLIQNSTYANNLSITKRLVNNESISLCNNDNFKLLCSSITEEAYFSSFKISTNKANYFNRRKYLLIQNDLSVFNKIIKKKVGRAYKEWIKSEEIETMFHNYNLDLKRKKNIENKDNYRFSSESCYSKEEANLNYNSESFEEIPSLEVEDDIPNFKIKNNDVNKNINYCNSNKIECYFNSETNNITNDSLIRNITQDFVSFDINHRRLSFTDNLSQINSKNNFSFSNDSYFSVKRENNMTEDKNNSNKDEYRISKVISETQNTHMDNYGSEFYRKSAYKNTKIGKNKRNSGILNKLGLKDYKEKSRFYKTNILDVNKIENELNSVNIVNIKENKNLNISSRPYFYNYLLGNIREIEDKNERSFFDKEAHTLNNIITNKTNNNNKMQSSKSISFFQHKENKGFYCDEKNENNSNLRKNNIHTSLAKSKYPILEEDELLKIFNIENEYKVYVHSLKSIYSQIKDTNRNNTHNKTKDSSNNIIEVKKKSKIDKFLQDDRKIFQYIWSEIKEKHSLLNLFFFFSIIYPFHIRLLTFFYETSLSFALNAIFYSDSMIEARANKQLDNEGSVGFWFTFTQNLYVSFVSAIIPTFFMQTIGRLIEPSKNCILFFQKQLITKDVYTIKVS